jgi:nucleotide-binding universal stress UspA family protein
MRGRGTILIGFDGSADAENAIRRAGELLAPKRAIVAYVWDSLAELLLHTDLDHLTGEMKEAAEEIDADDALEAERIAARGARLASTHGLEVRAEAVEGQGNVWRTLLDTAEDHRAAAIVVGSRGTSGLEAVLVGSVSKALVHHSSVPVLIVRPPK